VEQRAQLDFLGAQGCDEVQGFLFSRPVAAEKLTAALERADAALAPVLTPRRATGTARARA